MLVGAGPTGVEMAGAIAELAHKALVSDFRHIDPRLARIILVEAGPRILATFPEGLAQSAQRALIHLGVEVRSLSGLLPVGLGLLYLSAWHATDHIRRGTTVAVVPRL